MSKGRKMKTIIIGANRGIGLEFCRKYKDAGHEVIALCRQSNDELDEVADRVFSQVDVSDQNALKAVAEEIKDIDQLIHVAGILRNESIQDMNYETIIEQFEINTLGPIKSVIAFKDSLKSGAKVGLLTSRMGSIEDNDSGGRYGYRISKAALNAAAKSLSIDLKPDGIAIAILHPGYVRTDMTGGNGLINTDESVWGMMKVMEKLNLENTGTFWHTNGEVLPW